LVGKPEGNRPLRRPRRKWKDNIRLDLMEIGCEGMNSSGSAQTPVACPCEHSNESLGSIKGRAHLD